ncbi:MAG: SIS domain-containing protein [Oscillospiraceae bacterium]|nr:SIS domain-containing protein [Oscillospiraceae bacterium]
MLKFDEQKQIDSVRGALALRTQIERIIDGAWAEGIRNICWLGIGGTWASCMQAYCHMKERSGLDVFVANAAEYCTTGDRRIGQGSLIIISSVTGTTSEIIRAVEKAQAAGAFVFGFIDREDATLAAAVDVCVSYKANEQLKFFMAADRLMWHEGVMPEYDEMYAQFDSALPEALAEAEKAADDFGSEFALKHKDDAIHYFVGAGALYGATYSYAMCYWEEMHWIRTRSIHAAEFFHGMLEIVDEDTPVTVFVGEDSQRSLGERVARFLPKICHNCSIIDTKDYALPGIDDAYRPAVCHLVMHAVTNRIDAHLEALSGHDMQIRRYYRKLDY